MFENVKQVLVMRVCQVGYFEAVFVHRIIKKMTDMKWDCYIFCLHKRERSFSQEP